LCVRRGVSRHNESESIYKRSDHKRDNERATLKLVGNSAIKAPPLTELGCADTDAAAVAEFVNFIEDVHDIETDVECRLRRDLDSARQADIECLVGMVLLSVSKTPAQPIPIKSVDGQPPIVPRVGNPGRSSETLIVIEENPVLPDVGEFSRIEEKLRGTDVRAARPFVGCVEIRRHKSRRACS